MSRGMLTDLAGNEFGLLKVIERAPRGDRKNRRAVWQCLCRCGLESTVGSDALISGKTKSCGCLAASKTAERFTKHGHAKGYSESREYVAWVNMRKRCSDRTMKCWPNYGGRGIAVCPEWESSFEAFLGHVGASPGKGYELDRINNDGDYAAGNVRWVTKQENNLNKRPRKKKGCA